MFNSNYSIETENLCKTFPIDRTRITMFELLKKKLFSNYRNSKLFTLSDINIKVEKGEIIGIVGNNGSGKTTLLKLIAGLYKPNTGKVIVNGNLTLLAGLGIGMLDEISVLENVFLYGSIVGLDREKIKENILEILEWAELKDFMGAKLKNLSSGMRARLAFSTIRFIETDIFLFDEVLTAGDRDFKEKCKEFLNSSMNGGKTYLIATHDMDFLKTQCKKTLWLDKGVQKGFGETENVLKHYEDSKLA